MRSRATKSLLGVKRRRMAATWSCQPAASGRARELTFPASSGTWRMAAWPTPEQRLELPALRDVRYRTARPQVAQVLLSLAENGPRPKGLRIPTSRLNGSRLGEQFNVPNYLPYEDCIEVQNVDHRTARVSSCSLCPGHLAGEVDTSRKRPHVQGRDNGNDLSGRRQ